MVSWEADGLETNGGFFFVWTGDRFRLWVVEVDEDCGFSGGCLVAVVVVSALRGGR